MYHGARDVFEDSFMLVLGRLRTQTYFRSSLFSSWWCFLTSLPYPNTKLTLTLTYNRLNVVV